MTVVSTTAPRVIGIARQRRLTSGSRTVTYRNPHSARAQRASLFIRRSSSVRLQVLAVQPLRQARCLQEPLRARRGDADARQVRALLEEQEPRLPDGPVLGVGAVQRLDLPPAG